jgi:3-oxoacyl-[acyl-carrier protein] reductase
MFSSIAGRCAVVTGASRGIGRGIAKVFADAGANVLIVSRTEESAAVASANLGENLSGFAADVTDQESCAAFAAAAEER